MLSELPWFLNVALFIGLMWAVVTDILLRRIPNWLALTLALCGVAVATIFDGPTGFIYSLIAGVLLLLVGLWPFSRGWLGGGDIKLIAAVGTWVGLFETPLLLCCIALCGGLLSGVSWFWAYYTYRKFDSVPYAVAIAGGVVLMFVL